MAASSSPSPSPSRTRRARWVRLTVRLVVRLLLGSLALLVLLGGLLVLLVRNLDSTAVKPRLLRFVAQRSGYELDYATTRFSLWHGLLVGDLVVRTPLPLRPLGPELLHLGSLELGFSPGSLLSAHPHLLAIELHDLALTLIEDAEGRTSLSLLPGSDSKKPAPVTPLSHRAASLLHGAPLFDRLTLDGLRLTYSRYEPSEEVERFALAGLVGSEALTLLATPAGDGWQLGLTVGSAESPRRLQLTRERSNGQPQSAEIELQLAATVSSREATAGLGLKLAGQTLAPTLQLAQLAKLRLAAQFDRPGGRTIVSLSELDLGDGAATLHGSVVLPDRPGQPPLVETAQGALDLLPLGRIVPQGLLPLTAQRATVRLRLGRLQLSSPPQLLPGGQADVEGEARELSAALPSGHLSLASGRLTLQATPTAGQGTALRLSLPLERLVHQHAEAQQSAASLHLTATAELSAGGVLSGDGQLGLRALELTQGATATRSSASEELRLDSAQLHFHASELHLEPLPASALPSPAPAAVPLVTVLSGKHGKHQPAAKRAVQGHLTVRGELVGLRRQQPNLLAEAESLGVEAQARLTGVAPYGLDLELPLRGLRVSDGKGRLLLSGPARLSAHAADVYPDAARPQQSRGSLKLGLEYGALHLDLDAHKQESSLDFDLSATATSLGDLRPLLPEGGALRIPLERIGLGLHSVGRLEQLFLPTLALSQKSELHLERPSLAGPSGSLAASSLTLLLSSRGRPRATSGELELRLASLVADGSSFDDLHLVASGAVDLDVPSLKLRLDTDGSGPKASLSLSLLADRARRGVDYDVKLSAARLGPLAPLLAPLRGAAGFDLSTLEVGLDGRGQVGGLFASAALPLKLMPQPLSGLTLDGTLGLRVAGLAFEKGSQLVRSPLFTWHGSVVSSRGAAGIGHKLHGQLELGGLHFESGSHALDFVGASDDLEVSLQGDLKKGLLELHQQLKLEALRQDFYPGYALSGLSLSLRAQRSVDGLLEIGELKLTNSGSGTALDLAGSLDLAAERRSLSLHGTVEQKLDQLLADRARYVGRGAATLTLRLDSGDLKLFHAQGTMKVVDGDVALPERAIAVEKFNGEVPIRVDLELGPHGLRALRSGPSGGNVYWQIRYADQHPLMSVPSFITVGKISSPLATVSDLAGNLRIEQSLVSLDQFELGVRGGHVSGQCLLDLHDEESPTLQLRLRASRIMSSHGERFDGNAALVVDARNRSVEGRAEILQIGKRHLLDLLDLSDPQRGDAAMNRIRRALSLGYPDRLSLAFDHGFANARISFAGLAGLIRIDPLRGIPMGPIIDKYFPQAADAEDQP